MYRTFSSGHNEAKFTQKKKMSSRHDSNSRSQASSSRSYDFARDFVTSPNGIPSMTSWHFAPSRVEQARGEREREENAWVLG